MGGFCLILLLYLCMFCTFTLAWIVISPNRPILWKHGLLLIWWRITSSGAEVSSHSGGFPGMSLSSSSFLEGSWSALSRLELDSQNSLNRTSKILPDNPGLTWFILTPAATVTAEG